MPRDRLMHLHATSNDPCVACGDLDDGDHTFTTDVGKWNSEKRNCSPSTIVARDYTVTGRADPRTSALKEERFPDPKKVRDPR